MKASIDFVVPSIQTVPVTSFEVSQCERVFGEARVPGDKSIGHRALLLAALARGKSRIVGLSGAKDNLATRRALEAMGVPMHETSGALFISGVGLRGLRMPKSVIDCGNSGTTMRLLAGVLCGQKFGTRLIGDASLSRRPMGRIVAPLRARGAHIGGSPLGEAGGLAPHDNCYAPLSIAPLVEGEALSGLEYNMPIASAQVKSALLLSGLYADGPTVLNEPTLSRDHTERMLMSLGVPIEPVASLVGLNPTHAEWKAKGRGWDGVEWEVPGDVSSAAFLVAACLMQSDSEKESRLIVRNVGDNPTRTGLWDALRFMGADIQRVPRADGAGGEPVCDLYVRSAPLRGGLVAGELLVRMIDEVPALCAIAATAKGSTEIRDAAELRVKESDRLSAMTDVLSAFGVKTETLEDGMIVHGTGTLRPARVSSRGDHRIAMAAALLASVAEGTSVIDDVECIDTSFVGFAETMTSIGLNVVRSAPAGIKGNAV